MSRLWQAADRNGEVIVVDDASDTPAELTLSDPEFYHVRHLRNPTALGGGGSPSRNRGGEAAQGEVLFFFDDDDEIIEGHCAKVLTQEVQAKADFGFSSRLSSKSQVALHLKCALKRELCLMALFLLALILRKGHFHSALGSGSRNRPMLLNVIEN
ncbi:glycosyltransferase family 2 protein [Thalassobium sp. R2A62]|uniref:glycosyltransferase family 2 protein n=1 Tax=Thalassobium sp. R2A62 TaxID=633131 RepID=UPI000681B792|nr:glycosyltransferase [Thalassobium sp. R2A62]